MHKAQIRCLRHSQHRQQQKGRKMAAYVCPSGYALWKSYLSSLFCGSTGLLRFWTMTAYTSLICRNHRDCMTAQIHIFLMTHYHSEIASALLAGSMWLHLGTTCIPSIRLLSWVKKTPHCGLKAASTGHSKIEKEMEEDRCTILPSFTSSFSSFLLLSFS